MSPKFLPQYQPTPQELPHLCLSGNPCGSGLPHMPQHFSSNSPDSRSAQRHHAPAPSPVYIFLFIERVSEALRQKRGNDCGAMDSGRLTIVDFSEATEARTEAIPAATAKEVIRWM